MSVIPDSSVQRTSALSRKLITTSTLTVYSEVSKIPSQILSPNKRKQKCLIWSTYICSARLIILCIICKLVNVARFLWDIFDAFGVHGGPKSDNTSMIVNLIIWDCEILYYPVLRSLYAVTLTLTPKANQHICQPNTYVTKIRWNFLYWVLRYGFHKVFGTHRLTHSQTDRPESTMPPAPFFNAGEGIKIKWVWSLC